MRVIGRFEELPAHIQERLQKTEQATAHFTKYTLGLALNYGSRTEIIDALRAVTKASKSGDLNIDNFDYNDLRRYLQTGDISQMSHDIGNHDRCHSFHQQIQGHIYILLVFGDNLPFCGMAHHS